MEVVRLFKKDKKIFHLEEESVRRERKEKRFLWISFALILVFSVAAVFFVLKKNDFKLNNFFDPSAKTTQGEQSTDPQNVTPIVPTVTGKSNYLMLGLDEDGKVLQYVLLIQCDLDALNFKVCALPANTSSTVGSRSDTLQGQYAYGRARQVVGAVSTLLGQPVDRYVAVSSDKFERIGRKLGTISYNVPEAISYKGTDFDLNLSPGEQSLTPETVLKLMRYSYGGNLEKQRSTQGQLAANALDQLLNAENVARSEKLFSEIINLIDTDITVADFTKSQNALLALSQNQARKPSEVVVAGGAVKNGAFTLNETSLQELKGKFAVKEQG